VGTLISGRLQTTLTGSVKSLKEVPRPETGIVSKLSSVKKEPITAADTRSSRSASWDSGGAFSCDDLYLRKMTEDQLLSFRASYRNDGHDVLLSGEGVNAFRAAECGALLGRSRQGRTLSPSRQRSADP